MNKYLIIALILVVVFLCGFFISRGLDYYENKALTQKLKDIETQKVEIDTERTQLKESIRIKAEADSTKELEVAQLHSLIASNNKNIINELNKIKETTKNYESEINTINIPVSNNERCERLCKNRAELGYSCQPDFCSQFK